MVFVGTYGREVGGVRYGLGVFLEWPLYVSAQPKRYARATLRRPAKAVEAVRPTRIVVVLPPEGARDLEAAEWVTSVRGKTVVMFQNGMAEATTPCRQGVPDMLRRIHAAPPDWGQRDRAWRQPPAQAWSLDRRMQCPSPYLDEQWGFFDVIQSPVYSTSPPDARIREAFEWHFGIGAYARSLGVIAPGYNTVISYAIRKVLGYRPSLETVELAMGTLRARVWDGARASFEAARAARVWSYTAGPDNGILQQTEADRTAQMLFERNQRKGKRKRSGRAAGLYSGGTNTETTKKKRKKQNSQTASGQSGGLRRSARSRKRRSDPVFFWNFKDTYVLALDEISAPTMTHCLIADRMKKRKLAHMLKLV